ncbi:MAG: endolytic transglycosylase MltG [Psychrilyobacter sp.]|uniref:endolytic transglycosylase MltG n=1 Tax=Psychrilyobacter sp. TaxID=2586924 RepID=UPI003C713A4E
MKTIKIFLFSIVIIFFLGISTYYYEIYIKKIDIKKEIEFEKGENVGEFLNKIEIDKNIFLKIYFRASGISNEIKAGYYKLDKEYTISEFFNLLKEGRSEMVRVTIPEGFTVEQIKAFLISKEMMTESEFQNILKDTKFPYITPNNNFEGYFFPETYYFAVGSSPKVIIKTILGEFLKQFPVEKYGKTEKDKLDFYKKLILASIIEREAVVDIEKPIIASVFYNRIKKGMRLESDATVNYIFGYEKRRIYYKDLKRESPYNTYRNHGLPPTPIGSPGSVAIKASLNPASTGYYFFVATYDGTNTHHFTKTYREHVNYQKRNKNKPK